MLLRKLALSLCALTLGVACLPAQTVTGSILGTVLDPAEAVVPNAPVTLKDNDTGSTRMTTTDSSGLFRFLNVPPATYSVSISAKGFKSFVQSDIALGANETRDIGKIALAIGNTTETISVVAEATSIQLASSEKSQLVDSNQLKDITLKGR